ncbi:HEAT repeat protein [Carpediemonas membranifera]|uniref:HEAT repeat protein n=1 Tax=Carpediemonas membranifera TaxID=201153 RepID=A0A8J6AQ57_9EUKA|nr:HEAT repeat protein [Carpediemonas membranifera]|eukprot:KAG9390568.1 HEAT repeat protein [Carpediemonas membranifera]
MIQELEAKLQDIETTWFLLSDEELKTIKAATQSADKQLAEIAAHVLSIVAYFNSNIDEAVEYAVIAFSRLFAVHGGIEHGILSAVITKYLATRDAALQPVFDRMFADSIVHESQWFSSLGMAIEVGRVDLITTVLDWMQPDRAIAALKFATEQALAESDPERRVVLLRTIHGELSSRAHDMTARERLSVLIHLRDLERYCEELLECAMTDAPLALAIAYDTTQLVEPSVLEEMSGVFEALALSCPDMAIGPAIVDVLKPETTEGLVKKHLFVDRAHVDPNLVPRLFSSVPSKRSLFQTGLVVANALQCGRTGNDGFLREKLGWLASVKFRARFAAIASLGAIHAGDTARGMGILKSHLPALGETSFDQDREHNSGGALVALGMVYFQAPNNDVLDTVIGVMDSCGGNTTVLQGAVTGLGLMMMGTADTTLVERIKDYLNLGDALLGEAAGMAIGLVMMGHFDADLARWMADFIGNTSHTRIARALALALGLMSFDARTTPEPVIADLLESPHALAREAAAWMIGLAHACTGNLAQTRRLLHITVSDNSDDTRRAAVTAMAFILTPDNVVDTVSPLARSYNSHARAGAAMVLGLTKAGTADDEVLKLLAVLGADSADHVRQAALVAQSMVLMQAPESKLTADRGINKLLDIAKDRYEERLTRYGAIISCGIINAGGCNASFSLQRENGRPSSRGFAAAMLFAQYPDNHMNAMFLTLGYTPRMALPVTVTGDVPEGTLRVDLPPVAVAYPKFVELEVKKKLTKRVRATLSVARNGAGEEAKEEDAKPDEEADVDMTGPEPDAKEFKDKLPARIPPHVADGQFHVEVEGFEVVHGLSSHGFVVVKKPDLLE